MKINETNKSFLVIFNFDESKAMISNSVQDTIYYLEKRKKIINAYRPLLFWAVFLLIHQKYFNENLTLKTVPLPFVSKNHIL